MIVDIGTAVPLKWFAGADVGPVTVVVSDPTGVPTTITGGPFSTSAPIGNYDAGAYLTTMPGRHVVTWTAATPPARIYSDIFDVRPPIRYALLSVADAKAHLRLKRPDEANDDTIAGFIESASIAIKNITGPIIPEEFTEDYDGGVTAISVDNKPIMRGSVSVTEYAGTFAWPLTEQPLGGQTDAYGFTVDYTTGQVRRRTFGGGPALFAYGAKNVTVTYKAGRDSVPENVRTATKELVRHLWTQTQVPGRSRMPLTGEDGLSMIPVGFAVPNFVVQLLQNDQRPPGVA